MKNRIYIFSGLGADERAFQRLDFSEYEIAYIKWIAPLRNERIEQYATRLLVQIDAEHPTLIGLSFGGIMALEVAKQIKAEKVIVIASAKTKHEIPFYYKLFGALGLHQLLPPKILKRCNIFTYWFFGTQSMADKQILKEILRDTDSVFLKWAIHKIVRWKNNVIPANVVHIHGSEDKILPLRFVKSDVTVQGGGHFMTLNNSEAVSKWIRKLLN